MKTQLTLKVTPRTQTGRSASRRVRKANAIPAILYGKHTSPEKLSVDTPEFVRLLKVVSGRAVLIQLEQAGKAEKALSFLQEIQRDPITDKYLHLDLQEVKANELFEIRVPVVTAGESFGVKNQNGVLEMNAHLLRVRCLPKDLPDFIEVNITDLKVGGAIHVSELSPIAGVEYLDDKNQTVVLCVEPPAEEVAAVVAAPVEGAVAADGTAAAPAAGDAAAKPGDAKAGAPAAKGDAKAAAPAGKGDAKAAAPAKK